MTFARTSTPVLSRKSHLVVPDSFRVREGRSGSGYVFWSVESYQLFRKNRLLHVAAGHISGSSTATGAIDFTLTQFLTTDAGRSSSGIDTRWDGQTLWLEPNQPINLEEHIQVVQILGGLHEQVSKKNFEVPPGFDGWWQEEKTR